MTTIYKQLLLGNRMWQLALVIHQEEEIGLTLLLPVRDVSLGASATSQISVTWELDKSVCPGVSLCGGRLRVLWIVVLNSFFPILEYRFVLIVNNLRSLHRRPV